MSELDTLDPTNPRPELPARPAWKRALTSWWVPVVIALAGVITLVVLHRVWEARETQHQHRNIVTVSIALTDFLLLLAWFVMLAPISTKARLGTLGAIIVLIAASAATLKFDFGTSGDLIPRITFRWSQTYDRTLPPVQVKGSSITDPDAAPAGPRPPNGAADSAQFFGPNRDGAIRNVFLAPDWNVAPPREVWRRPIGAGWSGFAVAAGRAITQEQRGDDELVVCYELANGEPLWSHADKARYETTIAGIGPRATPTISLEHGRVYTVGATGILNCLDLRTGKPVWSTNILADAGAAPLEWGNSGSPLLVGDQVIVNPGGVHGHSLVAYHRETGERLWHAGHDLPSYASPMIASLAGAEQIIMVNQDSVTGHAIDDGRVLWRHAWQGRFPKVAQPLVVGEDRLFISAGYGVGCELVKITPNGGTYATETLWKNIYLKAKFANMVLHDGHIYGLNDGTLVCLDATSGDRLWRGERYGHGQLLLVEDKLLVQAEDGYVALVEATPAEFKELTRFTPLADNTWNSPTLAGRYLLVRNAREAACFELP